MKFLKANSMVVRYRRIARGEAASTDWEKLWEGAIYTKVDRRTVVFRAADRILSASTYRLGL